MGTKSSRYKSRNQRSTPPEAITTAKASGASAAARVNKMGSSGFLTHRNLEWLALGLASLVSYWILTSRLVGVKVSVLVDEYSYVLDAHYRELSETVYPNHLFQLVYSATKVCGAEFYSCVRSVNAVFVVGSGIVLYLFAKYLSKRIWLAAAAFLVTVFGSMGTYTAYFMPEAIFNFFMVAFFYALYRFSLSTNPFVWAAMGALLGIASLAKPHAFFLVPALALYIILLTRATESKFLVTAVKRLVVFFTALVGTKLALGFAIAGERGLSIFGSYGGAVSSVEAVSTTLGINTWTNVPMTLWGQILMTTMILGLSLPVAIVGLLGGLKKNREHFLENRFRTLFALALLNMVAVAAIFEAWQNLLVWMHTRYYSYLIPLAIIVLIEALRNWDRPSGKLSKRLTIAGFIVLSLIALFTAAIPYGANWIDAPDFKAHIDNLGLSSVAILVAIGLVLWWIWDKKLPVLIGIVFMVLTSIFSGTHISNFLVASFGQDSTYDHLGRVLRDYIPIEELDQTVLVGDNSTAMERVLFGALTGGATLITAPEEGFNTASLESGKRWLVKVGDPLIEGLGAPHISGAGFSLYSLNPDNTLQPSRNGVLSISSLCDDQQWSCGPLTEVSFSTGGQSQAFDVVLEISDLAAEGNLEFVLGEAVITGQFTTGIAAFTLNFGSEALGSTLQIRASTDSPASSIGSEKLVRVISVNVVTPR